MLILGILGYCLRKFDFDPAPLVLGLVISPVFKSTHGTAPIRTGNGPYTDGYQTLAFEPPTSDDRR
jgi:TctA family transporter